MFEIVTVMSLKIQSKLQYSLIENTNDRIINICNSKFKKLFSKSGISNNERLSDNESNLSFLVVPETNEYFEDNLSPDVKDTQL